MIIGIGAASGRLGRCVLEELVSAPQEKEIVAIVRNTENFQFDGAEVRSGDYNSVDEMTQALKGVDIFLMISAPVALEVDRIKQHKNAITAAVAAGVQKVVFTSVIGNGLEESTMFAETQHVNRQTEEDLKSSGLEWIIGRSGLYLDLDLLHILRANQEEGVYSNNGGDGRCGYISIAALGYAFAQLCLLEDCNGLMLNLVGKTYTQTELVNMANKVFGLNVRYQPITTQENIARFMKDEKISARGEKVARMLSGCFECINIGAYDVESHYFQAAGRDVCLLEEEMELIRDNPRT
ncbi:MAG: NAD(P)H-binding protein [Pseudomonadota bacterium]|nr:NAD(P)H-binding protein [Pseudomonadota bacterium]